MEVGIVGAGAMGTGIAQVAAAAGCHVRVYDQRTEALQRSRNSLEQTMASLCEKGKMTAAAAAQLLSNIAFVGELAEMASCELVIEAIVEQAEAKQALYRQLENVVGKTCVLATNTSSLSVTGLAAALALPERFVGMHFFNPAPVMQLVEIVPALQTAPEVAKLAYSAVKSWGKLPVTAKDTPGFIVNKVARPYYSEALRLYDEGLADMATIDWAMTTLGGFKMGPFALMDYIGHDVNYTVTETVYRAFYEDGRYRPSFTQKRLVEAGYLGKKAGRGFYGYSPGADNAPATEDPEKGRQILNRIVAMLINEAADTLYMGIASRDDIDTAMTKGTNYPKGLLAWADEWGLTTCVQHMDALYDEYREERYRCSPLLRKMAKEGRIFWDVARATDLSNKPI